MKNFYALLIISFLAGCNNQSKNSGVHKENVQQGVILFNNTGCTVCHSLTSEVKYGPSLNLILNTGVTVIRGDKKDSVKIDRQYIFRSIQEPDFEKDVKFRNSKMPKPNLTTEDIECLTDFIMFINTK